MTTLAADSPRTYAIGDFEEYPVVASDIIYQGAAVGIVAASGHARPLVAGDPCVGFAVSACDNSSGAAAAKTVRVQRAGMIQLAVSGALITDVGQPVYATDDATFQLPPVGGSFVGLIRRWVSAGVVLVQFGPTVADPYARWAVRETVSDNKTLDAEDCAKLFWVDTDAKTITLPAIAAGLSGCMIVNGGGFGSVAVTISPNSADMILGPDITGADDKDLVNTKATARRGDRCRLIAGDADGYMVTDLIGTWARQA
jgi:hypothetical protein